ncbi:MAG TPA: tetratricopeptide repeat protein, partial [Gemmataceae bacterium]|nr:tetratricopeptide repeat protein [Gemmataceae bacterium]
HYERAVALAPNNALAHNNLGIVLRSKGKLEEAIRHFEEALRIDPKLANARYKLSVALEQRNLDEAVRHYEEALRLDPKNAAAHVNLGDALSKQRKRDQAISHFEQALRLDPKNAAAHNSLGMALGAKGKPDEAIRHYEEALCLDPKNANAHVNLGNALRTRGKPEEVIRHYEEALRLDPKLAQTHYGLGQVLLSLGRLAEAQGALRRGHALVPERDPLHGLITRQLQRCERLLALEARLPAVLAGKEKPADAAEWLELAGLCQTTKRYATAARFYADAFAADPKLADRRFPDHRYNAARYAVLAAAGQGADGPKPDDKERALLRRQALNWLRAHLALRQKQAESAKAADRTAAQRSLRSWQKEANLASVREQQALATLPAEERAEWEKLWSDVAALLRRLDAGKPGAAPAGK